MSSFLGSILSSEKFKAEDITLTHILLVTCLKEAVRNVVNVKLEKSIVMETLEDDFIEQSFQLSESVDAVRDLLEIIEICFCYGLRFIDNKVFNPLLEVRSSGPSKRDHGFWDVVLQMEASDPAAFSKDVKHVQNIVSSASNMGLCRSWIRQLLNQKSLERTCRAFTKVVSHSNLYEEWAFLRLGNEPNRSMLFGFLAILNDIPFALDITAATSTCSANASSTWGPVPSRSILFSNPFLKACLEIGASDDIHPTQSFLVASPDYSASGRFVFVREGLYLNKSTGYEVIHTNFEDEEGWAVVDGKSRDDIKYFAPGLISTPPPNRGWRSAQEAPFVEGLMPSIMYLNSGLGIKSQFVDILSKADKELLVRDEIQVLRLESKQIAFSRKAEQKRTKEHVSGSKITTIHACISPPSNPDKRLGNDKKMPSSNATQNQQLPNVSTEHETPISVRESNMGPAPISSDSDSTTSSQSTRDPTESINQEEDSPPDFNVDPVAKPYVIVNQEMKHESTIEIKEASTPLTPTSQDAQDDVIPQFQRRRSSGVDSLLSESSKRSNRRSSRGKKKFVEIRDDQVDTENAATSFACLSITEHEKTDHLNLDVSDKVTVPSTKFTSPPKIPVTEPTTSWETFHPPILEKKVSVTNEELRRMIREYASMDPNDEAAMNLATEIYSSTNYCVGPILESRCNSASYSPNLDFLNTILTHGDSSQEDYAITNGILDDAEEAASDDDNDVVSLHVADARVVGHHIRKGTDSHVRFVIRTRFSTVGRMSMDTLYASDASIVIAAECDSDPVLDEADEQPKLKTTTVQRRFRDFRRLHSALQELVGSSTKLPPLPKTAWIRTMNEAYLINKRKLLNEYLQELLTFRPIFDPLSSHPLVIKFLTKDGYVDDHVRSPPNHSHGDRIATVPGGVHISLIMDNRPDPAELERADSEGLAKQNFKCCSCTTDVSIALANHGSFFSSGIDNRRSKNSAKFCHYTEKWFCPSCFIYGRPGLDIDFDEEENIDDHYRMLPTRILYHWDFQYYMVSSAAAEFLDSVFQHPLICVSALNPSLFGVVKALQHARLLRLQLTYAREAIEDCPRCHSDTKIIAPSLGHRNHLCKDTEMYSISDLFEMQKGNLIPLLMTAVDQFALHITQDCNICGSNGYQCEICKNEDTLFPFQIINVVQCRKCNSYMHSKCFAIVGGEPGCPKCKSLRGEVIS